MTKEEFFKNISLNENKADLSKWEKKKLYLYSIGKIPLPPGRHKGFTIAGRPISYLSEARARKNKKEKKYRIGIAQGIKLDTRVPCFTIEIETEKDGTLSRVLSAVNAAYFSRTYDEDQDILDQYRERENVLKVYKEHEDIKKEIKRLRKRVYYLKDKKKELIKSKAAIDLRYIYQVRTIKDILF